MENIVNCFELDFLKDIPTEMNQLQNENVELISSNRKLKTSLSVLIFGLGVFIIYKTWIQTKDDENNFLKSN